MTILHEPISNVIWDAKYRYVLHGRIMDKTLEQTWRRVARAIARAEKPTERKHWQAEFYRILENFRFLPGGRILAGSGTKHDVTLLNCYVMLIKADSLPAIFEALEEGALTLREGGGVGYDFSVLRPEGDVIQKTDLSSSGPVSFMRIWDTMCGVLQSTGNRRGAMMGVMRCDHPDIERFISAKKDPRELRHFNVSVMVTDAFMQAVKDNAEWPLVFAGREYRRIPARPLWENIIRLAHEQAEPGVLFADTINRQNNLWYCETINATNPCGEIPLPAYGACDLGSINLTQFVFAPFTANAKMNWHDLEDTVRIATRFLDNVLDVSHYPLKAQKQMSMNTRRIGLGLTGLADMLVMLNIRYGSDESFALAGDIMKRIRDVTWHTSIALAQEKGVFPFFTSDYLQGEFVKTFDDDIQRALAEHGVRNSHHNTIAPTGTISLLANNISSGIEPIFSAAYDRRVRNAANELETHHVEDYAFKLWRTMQSENNLPPAWVDINTLTPEQHLMMQATMQRYTDNAISKTINVPEDFSLLSLQDVYTQAYELGLKGCTVFRPNTITGCVLERTVRDEVITLV